MFYDTPYSSLIYIIRSVAILFEYNHMIKKLLIYLIKKYVYLELQSGYYNVLLFYCNPFKYYLDSNRLPSSQDKICLKLYKYLISLNIYYFEDDIFYNDIFNKILYNNSDKYENILIIKIKNQQEIWRQRRLFILLCIL